VSERQPYACDRTFPGDDRSAAGWQARDGADSAAALIEAVSHAAGNAATWEAEGRLITLESADEGAPRAAAFFRIVVERRPRQRAHLEVTGVPSPLVRVCDGSIQWGHLPASKQFWSVDDPRINACAEPFDEWPYLAADLHDPVITGREQLQPDKKAIECTVVSGDYTGPDASLSGKRILWIEDATKAIWQYRVERGTSAFANPQEPAVRIYILQHQTRDGAGRPTDFALNHPDGWALLPRIPPLRMGDGDPLIPGNPAKPTTGVYRVGNGVTAPIVTFKFGPAYTRKARSKHVEGTVVFYLEVGPDGSAHNIMAIHALDPGLDQKAIEAVSQWKFRPGMKDGVPVTVAATIKVTFQLADDKKRK
jgi:TonB family protein